MFTGIVTAIGEIANIEDGAVRRMSVRSSYASDSFELGCSIAHDGVCLTLVCVEDRADGSVYDVEVSPETLDKTTLGSWKSGQKVNLERALKIGDELGGHLLQGHVDGVGEVVSVEDRDGWIHIAIKSPDALKPFIAQKGSIAVDGVSLTVNGVENDVFELMIIPHTAEVTTIGSLEPGSVVNLEIDVMARYVARLMETRKDG
jgi:riboflavin synthase